MLLKIPPHSTQSKNASLGLCFGPVSICCRAELGSTALAHPQQDIRAAASVLLPALEHFLRQGILSLGVRWSWLGSVSCTGISPRRDFAPGKYLHTADGCSGAAWQGCGFGRGEGSETFQLYLPFSLPWEQ